MAWQTEVGASADQALGRLDFATKMVAFLTSQHVATVTVTAGGTGYADGDTLELTDAGAFLNAKFEVTGQTAGVIDSDGLRIISNGAYSNRIASAVVGSNTGSGYQVGDILELTDGSSREKGKVQVATLSGSAVATVTVFETGGAYSAAPSADSPTRGVGDDTFAGDDVAEITATMTGLISLTGNNLTIIVSAGGGGTVTVTITLAQTGWSISDNANFSGNLNDANFGDSDTDEKEVTLVGDATGFTNKPYFGIRTGILDSGGANPQPFLLMQGLIAHNPALRMHEQVGRSNGLANTTGVFNDTGNYLFFVRNNPLNAVDFWISADDLRTVGVVNSNPGTATDSGRYMHFYAGYFDRLKTESEDQYPFFIFGASRSRSVNPENTQASITGMAELFDHGLGNGPGYYYRSEVPEWTYTFNGGVTDDEGMFPLNRIRVNSQNNDQKVVAGGNQNYAAVVSLVDRTSSTRLLYPIPGSVDKYFRHPLVIIHDAGSATVDRTVTDTPRGALRDVFWIYNTDTAGVQIADFSEDYLEENGDRYRIFHTHLVKERYHYICIKEDV